MDSIETTTDYTKGTELISDENFNSESDVKYIWKSEIPYNFNDFSVSKLGHVNFFSDNFYYNELFNIKFAESIKDLFQLQNCLSYFFIQKFIPAGSAILVIGDGYENIFNRLTDFNLCSCWILENPEELKKDFSEASFKIKKYNSPNKQINISYGKFDFIFSISVSEGTLNFDNENFGKNIVYNLHRLLKPGGYINFNFNVKVYREYTYFSLLLFSFFKNHYQDLIPVFQFNHPKELNELEDLLKFDVSESEFGVDDNKKMRETYLFSYNVLLRKEVPLIDTKAVLTPSEYLKKRPAYFFHHLIKCGGSSLGVALQRWFRFETDLYDKVEGIDEKLRYDYNCDVNVFKKYKFNLENLSSDYCIRGHFQHEGIFIHQRYPEIFSRPDEFRIFTFIREPLQVLISLYYFSRKRGYDYENLSLEKCLLNTKNFLSNLLQCNDDNYREVLDKYFFIGIVERMQESFDKFADILGMKKIIVQRYNTTDKDEQVKNLKPEFIKLIKSQNELDYKIYNYCVERFDKL